MGCVSCKEAHLTNSERSEPVQPIISNVNDCPAHSEVVSILESQPGQSLIDNMQLRNVEDDFVSEFLEKFKPIKLLGKGTYGCVFEAEKNVRGRIKWKRAVKRIPLQGSEWDIQKTLKEVEVMLKFDHPGIIKFYNSWEEQPSKGWQRWMDEKILNDIKSKEHIDNYRDNSAFLYIEMELCHSTLADWLSDNQERDTRRMTRWFKQIVSAVGYIHEKGLIHRDLKPCNILLADEDVLKVCDLGIVTERALVNTESTQEIEIERTSEQGTPMYMAPEQRWSDYTSKVDIFALGLILVEMFVELTKDAAEIFFDDARSGGNYINLIKIESRSVKKLIAHTTSLNPNYRPDCEEILKYSFLVRERPFESEFQQKFIIQNVIATGAYGMVFQARNIFDKYTYAVKRIPVHEENVERDYIEATSFASLRHDAIVSYNSSWIEVPPEGWQRECDLATRGRDRIRYFDMYYPDDCVFIYIQMELCKETLAHWLLNNESTITISLAKTLFRQILTGVAYLHSNNKIHRDLKPSNIFFDKHGRLKIGDLGVITERVGEYSNTEDETRTEIGTRLYMAPEQMWHYNSKVDIFSIGLIFIEMCALMNDEHRSAVFDDIRCGKNEMLYALFENQQEVAHFVKWLTSVDPAERPTAQQILDHEFLS